MTKIDFLKLLQQHGIDSRLVVFDSLSEGYCVKKNHLRWEICFRERGKEYNCIGFPSESDALQYLFDKLLVLYGSSST